MKTTLITAAVLAATAASAQAAAPFRSGTDVELPSGASPEALAFADLDSNGDRDLLIADYDGGRLVVRSGNGNGTFRSDLGYPGHKQASSLAVADFDADGHEDVALGTAATTGEGVVVLENIGDGRLAAESKISLPEGRYARSLSVADFNDDGRTDLVAASSRAVSVRLGNGSGAFAAGTDVPAGAQEELGEVTVGDFDGDARDDVAVVVYHRTTATSELRILPGLGDGRLGTPRGLPVQGLPASPQTGDVNGDGLTDLVAAVPAYDRVAVRLGRADGGFTAAPDVVVGGQPAKALLVDVDRDGREDVVAVRRGANDLSVHLGRGDGTFRDDGTLPVAPTSRLLASADLTGDGTQDLAVGARFGVGIALGTTPAPSGNLLVNGSFEVGAPGRKPQDPARAPQGWETTKGMTFLRYGSVPLFGVPDWDDAARWAAGRHFLSGGQGGVTTASQEVDVSRQAAAIDAGRATATLSALLGGAEKYPDHMAVRAELVGHGGFTVGPVTVAERHGVTTMLRRSRTAPVPAGTRRIRVTLTSTDPDQFSSAIADDVRLTLSARPAPAPTRTPVPRPAARPGGDRVAPRISGLRVRRGRRLSFTLSEPARVRVRVARRSRTVRVVRRRGRAGVNRVRLRHLRRGRYRFTVRATDAAGNRSATRPRPFRRR